MSCDHVGQGGQFTVTVTDTGEGIPNERLGHVFDRFHRVDIARDRHHGGSGIGPRRTLRALVLRFEALD